MTDVDRGRCLECVSHGIVEQVVHVSAQSSYHASRADHVFENQCPTDEECCKFSHRYVAVDVRRSSAWHSGAKFRVTESWNTSYYRHSYRSRAERVFARRAKIEIGKEKEFVPANMDAIAAIANEMITAGPAVVFETDPAST